MRAGLIAAAAVATTAVATQATAADASPRTVRVYHDAHRLIRDQHVHVAWDGRYSRTHHRFCIETFNGTSHDARQDGYGVPPGFYVKFCSDGNFYANDGVPFKGMRSY